ncbi:hypothetical protein NQ315_005864 [Exocentrus adspersus]|uniref:Major facilitator superfamily (MFS) profile domain-containing protein n=1 Tax=Exocentrus adspersus TaxID=1586481 RepID=A0AAV8VS76_9CUCU|nr:hypothetical protein NQ315_005864 [Exocentrus adspersus]
MSKDVKARGSLCGGKISTRYVLAVLGSVGMGIVYGLKVNLHVAIVSMVNHTAVSAMGEGGHDSGGASMCADESSVNATDIPKEDGPFIWSKVVQGILLSAYFWGYIIAQLPGGRIAELFSAKWVMFFFGFHQCPLRIGEGIGGGVTFPAMHVMLAHWAPPNERSVMSSIVYAGTALGTVIFMLLSGIIAGGINWEAVFYIQGGASTLWLLLWAILIADTPQSQKFISEEERDYIQSSLNQGATEEVKHEKQHKIPWKSALTSPAFLAILVAHTCSNWGWYMVLMELPLYMKTVLNFKISESAILTSMPFLCMWIFSMILSKVLDTLREKKIINTTAARKIATGCASVIPMICFIILCYIGCQRVLAVVLMTVAVMCIGGMFCGFLSNHIDIAPNFAGTLMAVTNTVATIPGITVPIFVGALTTADHSIGAWRIIFWTTVALYVIEIVVYMMFGSGEEQPWNKIEVEPDETQPLKPQKEDKKDNKAGSV